VNKEKHCLMHPGGNAQCTLLNAIPGGKSTVQTNRCRLHTSSWLNQTWIFLNCELMVERMKKVIRNKDFAFLCTSSTKVYWFLLLEGVYSCSPCTEVYWFLLLEGVSFVDVDSLHLVDSFKSTYALGSSSSASIEVQMAQRFGCSSSGSIEVQMAREKWRQDLHTSTEVQIATLNIGRGADIYLVSVLREI
jgi:hypothetical protein